LQGRTLLRLCYVYDAAKLKLSLVYNDRFRQDLLLC